MVTFLYQRHTLWILRIGFVMLRVNFHLNTSSETQGQIVGRRKLGKGEKIKVSEEKAPSANGKSAGDNVSPDQFQTA